MKNNMAAVMLIASCLVFTACSAENTEGYTDDISKYEHIVVSSEDNKEDGIQSSNADNKENITDDGKDNSGSDGSSQVSNKNSGEEAGGEDDVTAAFAGGDVFDGIRKHVTPDANVAEYLLTLDNVREGEILTDDNAVPVVYYMQTDERWKDVIYGGTDTIGTSACGPTSMSIVVSSLTDIQIDPVQMSAWANANGYWYPESGSLHKVIPETAQKFGISCTGAANDANAKSTVREALKSGKLVVVLMGKGHFTSGGHFIVLRGIDDNDNVYVADPSSHERTETTWELSLIISEARAWAAADGPFWIMEVAE